MNTPRQGYSKYQTSVLFVFSFLTASTYVFVRALAVSLFLARAGPDKLPMAFAISALVVIGTSFLTRLAIRVLATKWAAMATWLTLATMTVLIGAVIGPMHHSLIALSVLYVFAELRGCLNTIYVVTFSNEAFIDTESKRPYAIVASGAPIAGILVGTVLGIEASVVLVVPAIILVAVLDGLTAIVAWLVPTDRDIDNSTTATNRRDQLESEREHAKDSTGRRGQDRYRIQLAALMSLKITVLTLIGYQWKVSAANYYGSDEAQLLAYFAIFYAVSDVLIVLLQWVVAGKLMDRFGIGVGLIGFPIAIGLIGITAFFVNSTLLFLVVFTLGKGLNVLRRALHDPALTVAYNVVDPKIRPHTIVFVKGMVKPFAEAVSACLLLVIGGVVLEIWITVIWFLLTVPWLIFAFKVTSIYRTQRLNGKVS